MKILINERQLLTLVLEQKDFRSMSSKELGLGNITTSSDATQTYVKTPTGQKVQSNPVDASQVSNFNARLKEQGLDLNDFIESFREKLYSPTGIAIEAFLSAFGVPEIPMVAYAGLTAWDVYQSFNEGKVRWGDLFFDLLGLISAGAISGALAPFRLLLSKARSLSEAAGLLKSTSIWVKILPYLKKIVTGLGWIITKIIKGISWLANKLGLTYVYKKLTDITTFIKNNVTKLVEWMGGGEKIAKATGKGTETYVQQSAILGGITAGVNTYQKIKGNEIPDIDRNYVPSNAELKYATTDVTF